jgi:hypothetical protein
MCQESTLTSVMSNADLQCPLAKKHLVRIHRFGFKSKDSRRHYSQLIHLSELV